jgi:hypothetical protein
MFQDSMYFNSRFTFVQTCLSFPVGQTKTVPLSDDVLDGSYVRLALAARWLASPGTHGISSSPQEIQKEDAWLDNSIYFMLQEAVGYVRAIWDEQ